MMVKAKEYAIKNIELPSELSSERFAKLLAACITPKLFIAFSGEIGTGKTTIIRAMFKHLGIENTIKSPTFSLVESYKKSHLLIHHFDLYRIQHEDELAYLGFRDYFTESSVCVIEWAERAGTLLPQADISFKLSVMGGGRLLQMASASQAGETILARLVGEL